MKKLIVTLSSFVLALPTLKAAVEAPENLRLQWSAINVDPPSITLTWTPSPTEATGGYRIERRLGGVAWPAPSATNAFATVTGPPGNLGDVGTWTDPLTTHTTTTPTTLTDLLKQSNLTITYRVRPIVTPTVFQRASEVITAGSITAKVFDTDGDGMSDTAEQNTLDFNPNDWADATGDTDGDGFPNAWEIALSTDPRSSSSKPADGQLDGTIPAVFTVDPSVTATTTTKATISAALAYFTGGATTLQKYRVIRVKPGIYHENLIIPANYHVAIIPYRTVREQFTDGVNADSGVAAILNAKSFNAKDHFEIAGVVAAPTKAVITVTGTLVLDSFHISRAAGSRASIITVADDATASTAAAQRLYQCRMVNCVVANVDAGLDALIEQTRSRMVISHCAFYMNSTDTDAPAHSYTTGTDVLSSTARLQLHNSIFWNPINVSASKPEFQSIGEVSGSGSTVFDTSLNGVFGLNPGLTPTGYISGATSSSYKAAITRINLSVSEPSHKKDIHAPRDMHGEYRYRHILTGTEAAPGIEIGHTDNNRLTDVGPDQWVDSDGDQIPDSFDRQPGLAANAALDGDSDLLNELMEYLGSTSNTSSDSPFLTVNQARSLFSPIGSSPAWNSFYTKAESDSRFMTSQQALTNFITRPEGDARYMPLNPTTLRTVRVAPGGNISMGEFDGTTPAP